MNLNIKLSKDDNMAVKNVGEKYKCNICGNVVEVINSGGGTLLCCNRPMQKFKDVSASLLERKEGEDELEKEELKEMIEEIEDEPEEEQ
jgi:desulfoferrodoxin-like iron-binding protein